jgi:hypothetical protein
MSILILNLNLFKFNIILIIFYKKKIIFALKYKRIFVNIDLLFLKNMQKGLIISTFLKT